MNTSIFNADICHKYTKSVFINCPFDIEYEEMFRSIVFTIHYLGFIARCALEANGAGEMRLDKIMKIIGECKYGIHDLSRVELSSKSSLPRFNMPFELGLFVGCRQFGYELHKDKKCLILDQERYRYQRFISDMAGQDISSHDNETNTCIKVVRNWLREESKDPQLHGSEHIIQNYAKFRMALPKICKKIKYDNPSDLLFVDFKYIIDQWLIKESNNRLRNRRN